MNENIALEGPRLPEEQTAKSPIDLRFPCGILRKSIKTPTGVLATLVDGSTVECHDLTCQSDADGYLIGDVQALGVVAISYLSDQASKVHPEVALLLETYLAERNRHVASEAERLAAWEERWKNAPIDARGYFDLRDPEVIEAACARADARDRADQALTAQLDATPKVWCIQRHRYEGGDALAIFATEEAANAALPSFEHKGEVEVGQLPFFSA